MSHGSIKLNTKNVTIFTKLFGSCFFALGKTIKIKMTSLKYQLGITLKSKEGSFEQFSRWKFL